MNRYRLHEPRKWIQHNYPIAEGQTWYVPGQWEDRIIIRFKEGEIWYIAKAEGIEMSYATDEQIHKNYLLEAKEPLVYFNEQI